MNPDEEDILPCYGIYNAGGEEGFVAYESSQGWSTKLQEGERYEKEYEQVRWTEQGLRKWMMSVPFFFMIMLEKCLQQIHSYPIIGKDEYKGIMTDK